ncbi:MAG: divergent polysaccharide deacetylase family protein [Candidatus Omnitrophica bacterium]|nr:divergent polysaccharide deacetylase family protein [Candidatus Omnitrophota bacterium]
MTNRRKIVVFIIAFILLLNGAAFILLKGSLGRPPLQQEQVRARVAIVIDDWGYNLNCVKTLRQIDVPVTISILPNLLYSAKIANIAKNLGQEIILHLPLEPEKGGRDYIGLEEDTLTCDMDRERVIEVLDKALDDAPSAKGVSNHMGSLATKDERLMAIIFTELKKRDLFFLDNLVTSESICRRVAREKGIRCSARDVFLDNEDDEEYIRGQFKRLCQVALAGGAAIGIGHARPATMKVLKEEIPLMYEQGIKLIFVSELME